MVTQQELKNASEYFDELRFKAINKENQISMEPEERSKYLDAMLVADSAARGLIRYGPSGLEFLARNGFNLNTPGIFFKSQTVIINTESALNNDCSIPSSHAQAASEVTLTYAQILPYEERVKDFRSLQAVEQAMRDFLKE